MTKTDYIIAVSTRGIAPKGESTAILEIEKRIGGVIQELSVSPWYLTAEGFDEKTYHTASHSSPLTDEEVAKFKKIFESEKRNLEIYKLEKQ